MSPTKWIRNARSPAAPQRSYLLSFKRFEYSSIFPVTQYPRGHRAGTSARWSCRQMSMKCHGLVKGSSSRNSKSGRIEAASIAVAIALLSADTPRMSATWLAAAGVRLSAAMIATILCPSNPQAHADTGQRRTANTTLAMQSGAEREDCEKAFIKWIREALPSIGGTYSTSGHENCYPPTRRRGGSSMNREYQPRGARLDGDADDDCCA